MLRCHASKALRLIVIAVYLLAMLGLVVARHPAAEALPGSASIASSAVLPDGEALVLCQHDGEYGGAPEGGRIDHSCCDACVLAHAPGLGAVAEPAIPALPVGNPVMGRKPMPGIVAIWRAKPTSRGPPTNA